MGSRYLEEVTCVESKKWHGNSGITNSWLSVYQLLIIIPFASIGVFAIFCFVDVATLVIEVAGDSRQCTALDTFIDHASKERMDEID